MIIDSHAHFTHIKFENSFRYLSQNDNGFCVEEGNLDDIFKNMREHNITAVIEPAIELQSNYRLLELAEKYPGFVFPAVGVHPTRTFTASFMSEPNSHTIKWSDRKTLDTLAEKSGVVAIGETGLDYHFERKEQHRFRQMMWFVYQIKLADRRKLPLILHIRNADKDAIRILKMYKHRLHGGVVHCFSGDYETADTYIKLGFHIGIGGALMQDARWSEPLQNAVRKIPLDKILVETDSPFVLPDCSGLGLSKKSVRKIRNTPLILPAVIEKIAQLKGITSEEIERTVLQNTKDTFGIMLK